LARLRIMLDVKVVGRILHAAFGALPIQYVDVHLPIRLLRLAQAIGAAGADETRGLSEADQLIDEHTSLPYLTRFLRSGEQERIRAAMLHADRTARMPKAFGADSKGARSLAFCPECVASDLERAEMAGWRRVHQMPGVFVCPVHDVRLRFSDIAAGSLRVLEPCPTDRTSGQQPDLPFSPADARFIAKGSSYLLKNPSTARADLPDQTLELLAAHGYTSQTRVDFQEAFSQRFSVEARHALRWSAGETRVKTPEAAFNTPWSAMNGLPIRYLAILLFLEIEPISFFAAAASD
jgi:hypothetical protein